MIAMKGMAVRQRRWTRKEYDRAIQVGLFHEDEKLELLGGRLLVAEPHNPPHAVGIELGADALRAAFGPEWSVRVQLPLALDPDSEPEPDLAVVGGRPRHRLIDHPTDPALVVEVADASLRFDRRLKATIYARAGIADYWILNVADRVLEVHREPGRDGRRWRYGSVQILGPETMVAPLAAPRARISIADLVP